MASSSAPSPFSAPGSPTEAPVLSPLQTSLLAGSAGRSPLQDLDSSIPSSSAAPGRQALRKRDRDWGNRLPRNWQWYDASDEREEQKRERRKSYPTAGHAHMLHAPQSLKKFDRILKLVSTATSSEHDTHPLQLA